MESNQRFIIFFLTLVVAIYLLFPQSKAQSSMGIPVWVIDSENEGSVILLPEGKCRKDVFPLEAHNCLLQAGMVLEKNKPCQYGIPNALAWGLKIDLNSASNTALQGISGIGPVTAGAIISYREENGQFKKIDDLLNVKGIGKKTLDKIKTYLAVQPILVSDACSLSASQLR